jgi:hypothetical protein
VEPDLQWIVEVTGASRVRKVARIQSLWGGYGELFRVKLEGVSRETAIVKAVNPPARRSRTTSERSHARKRRSYDVETAFYRAFAARCDGACRVAELIGARVANGQWLLLFEDLDAAGFPKRHHSLRSPGIEACLSWLATFHARFLGVPATGLWQTGTYWHLATRPDELAALEDENLRRAAPILDQRLRAARFQTLVHGDAKLDNFCFTSDQRAVAAVDFQYTGAGCGVKDVAYFLSSCSDTGEEVLDSRHLDTYFALLRDALARAESNIDASALEIEWRALYPIACADFYRFLAGWAPDQWRHDRCGQKLVCDVLHSISLG